jgi:asparagine synthetase B (glutamine-hydrolysing)
MTADTPLDTSIREPSATPDEEEMLLFALERSRAQFAWKCGGLDAASLRRAHPPSAMTIGGLVKHMAGVEERIMALAVTGRPPAPPWDARDPDDPQPEWRTSSEDSPEELYAMWREAVQRSRAATAAALVDGGLDRSVALNLTDGPPPNLRRVLVDLHDEYARHVGHADLFREAVDGLVGEDPPQEVGVGTAVSAGTSRDR